MKRQSLPSTASRPRSTMARGSILVVLAVASWIALAAAPAFPANDSRRPAVRPNRGHVSAGSARHGLRPVVRHHRSFYGGYFYRPSFYSAWYWPGPYSYYRPYGAYDGYGYWSNYLYSDAGALDLDIKPEEAAIYLDGELIGIADNYDGWPRYLWLREGTYHLVIHREGYQTLAREVRIRPGEVIALKDSMQPGETKSPEELFAQVERPSRPAYRERREAPPPSPREPAEDWRERRPAAPPAREGDWRERDARRPISPDQRAEPARLRLSVAPSDAVVYLDGRLLGSGEQLERLHSDLLVDPGTHRLEVTRPGYRSRTLEFEVEPGEARELDAELEPEG